MSDWNTAQEIAGLPAVPSHPAHVRRMAQREKWVYRPRTGRGGGVEYHIDSLPPETQAHLRAQCGASHPAPAPTPVHASTPRPAVSDAVVIPGPWSGVVPAPAAPTPIREAPTAVPVAAPCAPAAAAAVSSPLPLPGPIPGISELQQFVASRALRLTLKDLQDPEVQARIRAAHTVEMAPWKGKERALAQLAAQHQVTPQTIRRWCKEVETWRVRSRMPTVQMLDTTIPLPPSRSFDQAAVAAGIQIYARAMRRGKAAAYADLAEQAAAQGWRIGDYTSFTRVLGKVPARVWEYIKKGETGFELGVTPKIIRAWLSVPAYSVLCGDQNLPDYEIVDPATGEVFGPQLYLWMDCTSRAWPGIWPAYGHYSRYTVGAALREACRLGTPGEIFTDWGKPETSHYTAQLVAGLNGYCACGDWGDYAGRYAELDGCEGGVSHRKTTRVGIPWQKPIENQFNVLKQALLDRDLPGFRQRQAGAWENDVEQARLARERKGGRLLTTEQFFEVLRDIAEAHNREACRVKESEAPIVPAEVLARGLAAAPRPVFDDLTLDLLFLPRATRAVNQSVVRVKVGPGDLRHYYAAELSRLDPRERVQVSYDPFDTERPAVITTLGGDYVALAEPWTIQQPGDRDGLAEKIKRQMALMRWWREQVKRLRAPLAAPATVPRIAAVTKVARAADRADAARPDPGAAARADRRLLELAGLA